MARGGRLGKAGRIVLFGVVTAILIVGVMIARATIGEARVEPGVPAAQDQGGRLDQSLIVPEVGMEPKEWVAAHPAPADLTAAFGEELSVDGEPFPTGVGQLSLEQVLPQAAGAVLMEAAPDTVTLQSDPDNPAIVQGTEAGTDPGDPILHVVKRSTVARAAAVDWQCQWIREALRAEEADDPDALAEAKAQIARFRELRVIRGAGANLRGGASSSMAPVFSGDLARAGTWLNGHCRAR